MDSYCGLLKLFGTKLTKKITENLASLPLPPELSGPYVAAEMRDWNIRFF